MISSDISTSARKRRKSRLVYAGLGGSLLLNLFLIGILAGTPSRPYRGFAPLALTSRHGEFLTEGMALYLEPADAAIFREITQDKMPTLKASHARMREASRNIALAFESDPQDRASMQRALDDWTGAKADVSSVVKQIIRDGFEKLSLDGRRRLVELNR